MIGLSDEMFAAAGRIRQAHLDRIRALGVAPRTIAMMGRNFPPIGVVDAKAENNGLFQPGDGPSHMCQPVFQGGTLVDIVAWRTLQPDRWWLRTGNGWALHADDLLMVERWSAAAPLLHASPLAWLRSEAVGSVILDWSAPEIAQLRNHRVIACSDRTVADTLDRALRATVRMPSIDIKEMRHAA